MSYRRAQVLNGASLLWVIDTDEYTPGARPCAHVHRKNCRQERIFSKSRGIYHCGGILVNELLRIYIARIYIPPQRCSELFHVNAIANVDSLSHGIFAPSRNTIQRVPSNFLKYCITTHLKSMNFYKFGIPLARVA